MIDMSQWLRGDIRHMKRIGQHSDHKELRQRNEARLAALKAARRLTEQKDSNVDTNSTGTATSGNHRSPSGERPNRYGTASAASGANSVDLVNCWGRSGFQRG